MLEHVYLHVAIDDADSHMGGCTTYVTYRLLKDILREVSYVEIVDIPWLVRLNPYIPFKTRGNAATRLMLRARKDRVEELRTFIIDKVGQYAERRGKASPGVALLVSSYPDVPEPLRRLYYKALTDVVTSDLVRRICANCGVELSGGRGIIGAAAALGADLSRDSTYELLVYGDPRVKKEIELNYRIVSLLHELSRPLTFLDVDPEGEEVLLMPAGPDPVILGIRGESPLHIMLFASLLLTTLNLKIEGWLLYRTNQGTEVHVEHGAAEPRTYRPLRRALRVECSRRTEERHVEALCQGVGIWCYRHLGNICTEVEFSAGSLLDVWGGAKLHDGRYYVYIEGFRKLSDRQVRLENPRCPKCGRRLTSSGRDVMRCENCGLAFPKEKVLYPVVESEKTLVFPRLSEHRHLMKSFERVGMEGLAEVLKMSVLWIL